MPATQAANCGIYEIVCVPTGKFYLGSSSNLCRRKQEHWRSLRAGKHASPYLQRAWSKYGEGSFVFSVVEVAPELRLLWAEQYWLDFTGCCNPEVGFNTATSAVSPMKGRKLSTEGRARASAAKFKMWEDPARRKRMAAVQRGLWKDPEYRAHMLVARQAASEDPSTLKKLSAAQLRLWGTVAHREKMSASREAMWKDPAYKAKMSEARKEMWKDPAHRAKVAATKAGLGLKKQQGVQNV